MKYLRGTDLVWPSVILVLSDTEEILELNPAGKSFFAMLEPRACMSDLILPEDHDLWTRSLSKIGPGEIATLALTFLRHDLEAIRFKVTVTKDLREPILYLMATNIQDVADLERNLKEKHEKSILDSRLFALTEIAQGLSHEINNPLAILIANVAVLERELKDSKNDTQKTLRITQQISSAGLRIASIVKGLREICKSAGDKAMRQSSVREMIHQATEVLSEKLKLNGIQVILSAFADQEIVCCPAQLTQVLINLLNNSIDAVQELPERWIKIEINQIFEMIEISVIDSGRGLNSEVSDKIMHPFFSTKEVGQGVGLGLNISKAIIEDLHGRLYYDKRSPHTRFVIQLPLRKGASLIAISADDAIAAHLAWRQKLTQHFVVADPSLDPKIIAQDNKCSLGMWIYGSESRYGHMPCFQSLKEIHAQFHLCTAGLIESQQKRSSPPSSITQALPDQSISKNSISEGSEFDLLSKKIVSLIRLVKNQIDSEKLDVPEKAS